MYNPARVKTMGEDQKHMQCMEVWGGNRVTDSGVIMPGVDAWIYSQPCAEECEGGDVHYVSTCAAGRVVRMLVADVSGHGSPVANAAEKLRHLMRRYINNSNQLGLVRSLNREFTVASTGGMFATAVVMTFNSTGNRLLVSNAGHPPPLWYQVAKGRWTFLRPGTADEGQNYPWGIEEMAEYGTFDIKLRVGDIVLAYTDSLTEARNRDGSLVGEEGLLEIVQRIDAREPQSLVTKLLADLAARDPGNLTRDDVTCLMFRPYGLRARVPLRDFLLAPVRVVADWGGMRIGWSGSKAATAQA
ncbi:MAG TPA: PP2C family protein-serine/threonine phosphatase [Tepidisphaeraceae bacterium]|nr:PP2C family protein-serine/threonine phosphatase [Tepidisphaeraceae bacterium]